MSERQTSASYWRREADFAAAWAEGAWLGQTLRTIVGAPYTVVFQGRRGGSAGPDFRDAALARADGSLVHGDIELHLRADNWDAHGHASDPRYNNVVLHVTLAGDERRVTLLASGRPVPLVVLGDATPAPVATEGASRWPCRAPHTRLEPPALRALLEHAGYARFALHVAAFRDALAAIATSGAADAGRPDWSAADRILWQALAEGLGYGRDRAALRRAGACLLAGTAPQALRDELEYLPRVERARLDALLTLFVRWQNAEPWQPLLDALRADDTRLALRALTACLRVANGGVSPGLAAILIANVVLPFASAWAEHRADPSLATRARAIYASMGGLPSNALTREMARQLGLPRLPRGALAQQGLQHLWAHWCQRKTCVSCPCNGPPRNDTRSPEAATLHAMRRMVSRTANSSGKRRETRDERAESSEAEGLCDPRHPGGALP